MHQLPPASPLDQLTLAILKDLAAQASAKARVSASRILAASSEFLSKQAHDALSDFHRLYFDREFEAKKDEINDDVSSLFDQAQALMAAGGVAAVDTLTDTTATAKERIGIAHLQKQLEALISVNTAFKEHLAPVLSSMQFEDSLTQRLSHIDLVWSQTVAALASGAPGALQAAALDGAAVLSSTAERAAYYPGVLKEEAPAGLDEQSIWLDLSA